MIFNIKLRLQLIFFFLYSNCQAQLNIPGGASPQAVSINFNSSTSNFLNPPYVSAVINDPTDPAATIGLKVDVLENGNPILASDYTIAATSSKSSVVTVSNIIITKYNGYAIIKIIPTGVGYSDIKLTLTKDSSTNNITIKYAASAASTTPAITRFCTGISDASAAIVLDSSYMVIGDDEINSLFVYDRKNSGLPVATYDYQNLLGLTDGSSGNYAEIDLEAGVKSINFPNRTYWISSLGTAGSSNNVKPNINRLFAVDINGTGASTTFNTIGYYSNIRSQLITWGNANGFGFTASAASGHDAKTIDGFNVEGMCFGPDNTSLFIAFRAPLLPVTARTKALIAPILNFENWFNNGNPTGNPSFGNPILLDLGGRVFRDIIRLSNGSYIIIAGNYDNIPLTGAIFKWNGSATDQPILIPEFAINNINAETVAEITENGIMSNNKLQVISDNGSTVFYNDGTQAKDLSRDNYKKFRSDIISTTNNVLPVVIEYFKISSSKDYDILRWKINSLEIEKIEIEKADNKNKFKPIIAFIDISKQMEYKCLKSNQDIVYYRLKLLYKSGNTEFSQIISVKNHNINSSIAIYPNPSINNKIHIVLPSNILNSVLQIYDNLGKMIQQNKINSSSSEIMLKTKRAGNYLVKITTESGELFEQVLLVQ
ncbi:MAG: T9SS type A sorting domain-containing protein [Chitinophagaceae bacterium]